MPADVLAIIDGHYYAYRFFFGMPPLSGPGGRPTGVTYAFAQLFKDLRERSELTHWVLIFDAPGDTFRSELYKEYKAHRDPTPDPLRQQIADARLLAAASGIPVIEIPGVEADDVAATLAKQAAARGIEARILSKDKDIDQVLSDRIRTWDPVAGVLRGPAELRAEKGFGPEKVIDYLCMLGDASDNVPGIDGVGPKTAVKLIAEYGGLDGVIANVDKLKGKLQERVRAFIPFAAMTRDLITLRDVADLPDLETLRIDRAFTNDAKAYGEFGFNTARFAAAKPAPTVSVNGTMAELQPASVAALKPASDGAAYRIVAAASELPALVADMRKAGRFAFDTETTGLDASCARLVGVSLACGNGDCRTAAYIPIAGTGAPLVPWDEALPILKPLFEDVSVRKVAQNAKYDMRILACHGIAVRGLDGDTMLASWLLDPSRESHGIDHLTKSFFGEDKIPTSSVLDLKAGQTMDMVDIERVGRYACEDAQCAWRLAEVLEAQLVEHGLSEPYREQELPIAECLARMESRGVRLDPLVLAETQRHLEQFLKSVEESIRAVAGADFNPGSPKQIAALLFDKLKLPVISRTKSGPSTDAGVLEALRHLHELPELLLQWRMLSKLIGTYLSKLPSYVSPTTGRIHSNFKQTGTETGRIASDGPNLQNIPKKSDLGREIRAAFVADPGRVFLAADYSQIELRVLAHLSGDPTLAAAFRDDVDIHRFVAAQVSGCDPASVTPKQRNAAKAVNFGIIYGQTAFGLSQALGIPRGEAQQFIDDYFARFAKVRDYINDVVATATTRGYAETMAGRRRYTPQLRSGNRNERLQGERIALNSTIQGSAADLIKRAMLRCDLMLPGGSGLVLQIHDELLVEADDAVADAASAALHKAMTEAWSLQVPLVAEVRRGRNWFEVS
ncbi:MAG TPA: DNA polymerase I [Planctomycetota bacterium]|nr:DNA polymerase I [Planctomycetota bacterium]